MSQSEKQFRLQKIYLSKINGVPFRIVAAVDESHPNWDALHRISFPSVYLPRKTTDGKVPTSVEALWSGGTAPVTRPKDVGVVGNVWSFDPIDHIRDYVMSIIDAVKGRQINNKNFAQKEAIAPLWRIRYMYNYEDSNEYFIEPVSSPLLGIEPSDDVVDIFLLSVPNSAFTAIGKLTETTAFKSQAYEILGDFNKGAIVAEKVDGRYTYHMHSESAIQGGAEVTKYITGDVLKEYASFVRSHLQDVIDTLQVVPRGIGHLINYQTEVVDSLIENIVGDISQLGISPLREDSKLSELGTRLIEEYGEWQTTKSTAEVNTAAAQAWGGRSRSASKSAEPF